MMNKRELKKFIREFETKAKQVHRENVGYNNEKQKEFYAKLKGVEEQLGDDFVYHTTPIANLGEIVKDSKLMALNYPMVNLANNIFGGINYPFELTERGHHEQLYMYREARSLLEKNTGELDYETRIFILDELSKDLRAKVFFSKDITYFFEHDDLEYSEIGEKFLGGSEESFNFLYKGIACLVFKKDKLNLHKKSTYLEYNPEIKVKDNGLIIYYIGENEREKKMLEWIRSKNTELFRDEYVSYEDVSFNSLKYIMLIDKYEITNVIEKVGNKYRVIEGVKKC